MTKFPNENVYVTKYQHGSFISYHCWVMENYGVYQRNWDDLRNTDEGEDMFDQVLIIPPYHGVDYETLLEI